MLNLLLLFVFTLGRCGSTLLCKALDKLSNVQSISEPDIFTVLTSQYGKEMPPFPNPSVSNEILLLVTRVATKLLHNYFIHREPLKTHICYKLRAHIIYGSELLMNAVPSARGLYMYRNCLPFVESWIRITTKGSYFLYWILTSLRLDVFYLKYQFGHSSSFYEHLTKTSMNENSLFRQGFIWCFAHYWWKNIQKALTIIKSSPRFFNVVVKYEDLVQKREDLIFEIAVSLGIEEKEISQSKWSIASVFSRNSQEGSVLSSKRDLNNDNDVWFGEWEKNEINKILRHFGMDVDFELPFTNNAYCSLW